mmetsp:Transcript_31492/g.44700  ORF Transcript_31492/g.44700 Transcript_31492/m.44700 type:complete len:117 (+) Transcript_31492:565-915(+)
MRRVLELSGLGEVYRCLVDDVLLGDSGGLRISALSKGDSVFFTGLGDGALMDLVLEAVLRADECPLLLFRSGFIDQFLLGFRSGLLLRLSELRSPGDHPLADDPDGSELDTEDSPS